MIDPNKLIGKPYHEETYHCWHFIEEVMDVPTLSNIHVATANDDVDKYIDLFSEVKTPKDYSIVLLGRSHIGIWYKNNIYHNDIHGVRAESLRTIKMKYPSVKYYKVKK